MGRDQLATNFCCGHSSIQPSTPKLRICLALSIHDGSDIFQQIRQMLFTALSASFPESIDTNYPAFEFMFPFSDAPTIPTELLFCSPLPSFAQCSYCPCHKKATGAPF